MILFLIIILAHFLWAFHLITTLRKRIDTIENKLDLVLLHLQQPGSSRTDKPESPALSE